MELKRKKYEFELNKENKKLNIKVDGFFHKEEAMQFVSDYKKCVQKINTSDYIISVDCNKMCVSKPEIVDDLKNVIQMYLDDEFKKINFVMDKAQIIFKMQIHRLLREMNNTTKITLIE